MRKYISRENNFLLFQKVVRIGTFCVFFYKRPW